jgi:hypothetical protein
MTTSFFSGEIRGDDAGRPKDIVAKGVDVHIERLDESSWWIGIHGQAGQRLSIGMTAEAEIVVEAEEDGAEGEVPEGMKTMSNPSKDVDPVSLYFGQAKDDGRLTYRSFEMAPPPRNPVEVAYQRGVQHRNAATGTVLFQDNVMPVGCHRGTKTMRMVPIEDLWRYGRSCEARDLWPEWRPVWEYVDRNREEIDAQFMKWWEARRKV